MGWRFRKRIKILPGIHINISKSGISTNVGIKGASVTFGSNGTYVNTGFPGTGLYRRDRISNRSNNYGTATISDENNLEGSDIQRSVSNSLKKQEIQIPTFKPQYYIVYFVAFIMPILGLILYGSCGWWMFFCCLFVDFVQFICWAPIVNYNVCTYYEKELDNNAIINNSNILKKEFFGHVIRFVLSSILVFLNLFPLFAMNEKFIAFYDNVIHVTSGFGYFWQEKYSGGLLVYLMIVIMELLWVGVVIMEFDLAKKFININKQKKQLNENLFEKGQNDDSITNSAELSNKHEEPYKESPSRISFKEPEKLKRGKTITPNVECVDKNKTDNDKSDLEPYDPKRELLSYQYPSFDLLKKYEDDKPFIDMDEQRQNKERIVQVLRSFGITVDSIKATIGPTITLYEITLAPGIRSSRMIGLEDDLSLALCARRVRIIIPIPGRGTIGVEVSDNNRKTLSIESVLNKCGFQETIMRLPLVLGKTITNELFMVDLVNMPHLLISGSTGQGKSVLLHVIIESLLYKKHPAELKFVLMDSKGIELGLYRPLVNTFLAALPDKDPIVTNCRDAIETLQSLCIEMKYRGILLQDAKVVSIDQYNEKFTNRQLNPNNGHLYLPYIVIIIDEYSDWLMSAEEEMETYISQLTKFGRAIGIHLIISTQRPTNDIITGKIKSNFPARISFRVPEKIDSDVILDCEGAEELLDNGDMLYKAGKTIDLKRIQCPFIDTQEIIAINNAISSQQGYNGPFELPDPFYSKEESYSGGAEDIGNLDPLFGEAARVIINTQQGSTSLIQRKFSIGYNRAGRLMDQLEKAGVVGAAHGSKPRDVLIQDEETLQSLINTLGAN